MNVAEGACAVCQQAIEDRSAAVVVAGRSVCGTCAAAVASAIRGPSPAPRPPAPRVAEPHRPVCPRCDLPMRRGRRRSLRLSTLVLMLLGLAAVSVLFVPQSEVRSAVKTLLGIKKGSPLWERPDMDTLVGRGIRWLAVGGAVVFLAGVALATRPKRLWVCERCSTFWPRDKGEAASG